MTNFVPQLLDKNRRTRPKRMTPFSGALGFFVAFAFLLIPLTVAYAANEPTLDDVMGITREQFVSSVEAHWSSVYEGTPYEGWYLSEQLYPTWNDGMWWPRGNPSPTGHVGMNCGGFVARALTDAGADDYSSAFMADWWNGAPNAIDGHGAAAGHYANARTFWRLANTYGLEMHEFSNKWELLESGLAVKGDIIVMIDDADSGGYDDYGRYHAHVQDSHIGIFWGDSSDDDKFLHSSHDIAITAETEIDGCVLSTIQPKCWGSRFYLVKFRDFGGITLEKQSALPGISNANALYSLEGAEYGIFSSRSDAATHDESKALETYTTCTRGTWTSERNLIPGTYYVAETSAPNGFALDGAVYEVAVIAGADAKVNDGPVTDVPQHEKPSSWALKRDAETDDGKAQGSASLGGATFEVRYFDGYYDDDSLPESATRTWIVATDNAGVARVSDDLKVSGDDFYRDEEGSVVVPLGTIAVREVEAPYGYLLSDGNTYISTIKPNGSSSESVTPFICTTFSDYVQRGGVAVGKVDREYQLPIAQGAAMLENATFEITSENDQPIVVDGVVFKKGSTIMSISTAAEDSGFIARTATDALPVGSYSIKEASSSSGYLFDQASKEWRSTFSIDADGQIADLTDPLSSVSNQVIRGDFEFSKVDGGSMERLAGIPFMLTSQTTGESHILVTDENGMLSTAASWNSHAYRTNANDDALMYVETDYSQEPSQDVVVEAESNDDAQKQNDEDAIPMDAVKSTGTYSDDNTEDQDAGAATSVNESNDDTTEEAPALTMMVDESMLDASAGIWFNGRSDVSCTPDDELGALPYDTYTVTELPVSSNDGYELVSFDVTISRNARELDLGTLDDNEIPTEPEPEPEPELEPEPTIGTTLADEEDGDHFVALTDTISLVDTISFHDLTPGEQYLAEGMLHVRDDDGADAGPLDDAFGNPVKSHATFVPAESDGTVEVTFEFAPNVSGSKSIVAFEVVSNENGIVAEHADISDEGQTVTFEEEKPSVTPPPSVDEPQPEKPEQELKPKPEKPAMEPAAQPKGSLPKLGDPALVAMLLVLTFTLLVSAVVIVSYARIRKPSSTGSVPGSNAHDVDFMRRQNPTCELQAPALYRTSRRRDLSHRK